ncbi:terminase, partial [Pseudomonas ogarae]
MVNRPPNLSALHWPSYPDNPRHPTHLLSHLIAVPLFIIAFLLIVSG